MRGSTSHGRGHGRGHSASGLGGTPGASGSGPGDGNAINLNGDNDNDNENDDNYEDNASDSDDNDDDNEATPEEADASPEGKRVRSVCLLAGVVRTNQDYGLSYMVHLPNFSANAPAIFKAIELLAPTFFASCLVVHAGGFSKEDPPICLRCLCWNLTAPFFQCNRNGWMGCGRCSYIQYAQCKDIGLLSPFGLLRTLSVLLILYDPYVPQKFLPAVFAIWHDQQLVAALGLAGRRALLPRLLASIDVVVQAVNSYYEGYRRVFRQR